MRNALCRGFAAIMLAALSVRAASPLVAVVRQGEVKIDGRLDEAAWGKGAWQSDFVSASAARDNAGAPRSAAVQTRFKVLYDGAAIYVAAECDEPQIETLKATYTAHDSEVYADDCLELFMDPAGDGRYYHHFVVNSKGAWYDDLGADYGLVHVKRWECPLLAAGSVDLAAKVWRCEVRVPLAALQLRPDAGATWLWNVTRERHATGTLELSTWAPLKGNFHQPKLFGKLTDVAADYGRFAVTFGEPKVTVSGGGSGINAVELRVPVTNDGKQARSLRFSAERFLAPESAVTAAAFELAAGASQTVTLAGLKVRAGDSDAAIQLTATDTVLGEPVKIVVKRLDAEYRPLAVDVRQPVCRGNIYATESVPAIVFRVTLAADIAARTAQVAYALRAADGREVGAGKATLAQLAGELQLDAATLPVGTYALTVRALGQDGATVVETATTIRKLAPAPGSEVRVDELGNVLVNGKPKLFCGWYGGIPTEDPRAEVVALQDLSTPVVLSGLTPAEVEAQIGEPFRQRGVYSVVSIEPGRLFVTFKLWQKPGAGKELVDEIKTLPAPSEGMQELLRQLVAAVRAEPGVLGYYLADEPEINDARSDWMEATYAFMQELDPYHPLMVTNDTLDGIVTHGYKTCDLLSPDPYSPEWEYVPNFMKRCREVLRRGQAIMMTPWAASADAHFNVEYGKTPPYSYEVMRHQYLTALAQGCKGYTAYVTPFFMPEPRLRYGLPPIWREVRFLEAASANPVTPPTVVADAEMIAWAGEAAGKLYLMVSNLKAGSRSAAISHPLLKGVASLYVVSEGRTAVPVEGSFTDRFEAGAVHVYTTDPAGATLATMVQVAAEIKAQEAACVKPGNLLHWSRGVLARSGEGFYAPWFSQYYYYAINGVLDDDGWTLSHTDKPCTLELTLAREEQIGRVVLYTPNLLDFDLRLQAADGRVQVAAVRGNRTPITELRFAAATPVLKLRLTALAKADGAGVRGVKLREIEAYAEIGAGPTTALQPEAATAQAPTLPTSAAETVGAPRLWREDFTPLSTAPKFNWDGKDDKWVVDAAKLKLEPKDGGGVVIACTAAEGYASATHLFPYDNAYRYYQLKISDVAGEGYRWLVGGFGDSSGKPGFRGAVHTLRPGIYTVDTHYVNAIFREGTAKQCFLTLSSAGAAKQADGSVKTGPAITLDWLQLVRRPEDGLAVTLAGGAPLPEVLKQGDEVLFRLFLEQPALDATVEVSGGSSYTPIALNGQNSLQLLRRGAKDGREWAAQVKLGPGTGKFDGKASYPVFFRAVITGGKLKDTYATASLKLE
jgi:hypothetical protein